MAKVVIGIGLPGSGKTTLLKKFAQEEGYTYICPDDIRAKLSGNEANQAVNKEAWAKAYQETAAALNDDQTVVFNATFTKPDDRRAFLHFARESGARKLQGIFIDVPFDIAQERNLSRPRQVPEHAMHRMENSLKTFPPELADGLDSLFTLNENLELTRVAKLAPEDPVERELSRR